MYLYTNQKTTIMARKKIVKKQDLVSMYMEFVLENDHPPKSIFSFRKRE